MHPITAENVTRRTSYEKLHINPKGTQDETWTCTGARPKPAIVKIGENIGFGAAANEGLQRVTGELNGRSTSGGAHGHLHLYRS